MIKEKGETTIIEGKSSTFELMYSDDMKCHLIEALDDIRAKDDSILSTGIKLVSNQTIVIIPLNPHLPVNMGVIPANQKTEISLLFSHDATIIKGSKFMMMYVEDQDELTTEDEFNSFATGKGFEMKPVTPFNVDSKTGDIVEGEPSNKIFTIEKSTRPDVNLTTHIRRLNPIFHIVPTTRSWNSGFQFNVSVEELAINHKDYIRFSSNEALETAAVIIGIFVPTTDEWAEVENEKEK